MQIVKILRGCVAAYLVGSVAGWVFFWAFLSEGSVTSLSGQVMGLGKALWFGLPLAAVLTVVVVALWAVACLGHLRVSFWMAPVVSTVLIFALALLLGESLAQMAIFSLVFGVPSGLAFWVGAFGLQRDGVIAFHRDSDLARA